MGTKEALLALLTEKRGESCSGGELARRLGVSRGAIWKAAEALRGEGYAISGAAGRGYALSTESDALWEGEIAGCLGETAGQLALHVLPEVDSTNDLLRSYALSGAPEGTAVISGCQTRGRGRAGRSFFSPGDSGLYLSLLLRPRMKAEEAVLLTAAAAVAVCRALQSLCSCEGQIKWVNDIFLHGKKVAGILTEGELSVESGGLAYAIVGIGINVYPPADGFPPEIAHTAGCVETEVRGGLRNRLAAEILRSLWQESKELNARRFLDEYRARSLAPGRSVVVLHPQGTQRAQALGIDDSCRLLVAYPDGTQAALSSGEIRILLDETDRETL